MESNFLKFIAILFVVRIIGSALVKKGNKDKGNTTIKRPNTHMNPRSNKNSQYTKRRTSTKETPHKDIHLGSLKDAIFNKHENLGPMEKMAKRERELEDYLSRKN